MKNIIKQTKTRYIPTDQQVQKMCKKAFNNKFVIKEIKILKGK